MKIINPPDWPRPRGYANAIVARGQLLFLGGQIGWDTSETIVSDDFVEQFDQALKNIGELLKAADAKPEHVVRMTWFITDKEAYGRHLAEVGAAYRKHMGRHYPAMSVVEVKSLMEDRAKVEIEATAVIED